MDNHLDLRGRQIEKPASFDDFESLVHQSCRINGDPLPHFPVRMIERLLHSDVAEFRLWGVQEWATGSCQPHRCDFSETASTHALVDRVVFAVDWE